MLTPKETGGGSGTVFPLRLKHSALIETEYTAGYPVGNYMTVALGWKPTAPTTSPLNDTTGHYPLTIRKAGVYISVWKGFTQIKSYRSDQDIDIDYSDVGAYLRDILTKCSGSYLGYYSRLMVVDQAYMPEAFWKLSPYVTGLVVPKEYTGNDVRTCLDFSDALHLGYSEEVA